MSCTYSSDYYTRYITFYTFILTHLSLIWSYWVWRILVIWLDWRFSLSRICWMIVCCWCVIMFLGGFVRWVLVRWGWRGGVWFGLGWGWFGCKSVININSLSDCCCCLRWYAWLVLLCYMLVDMRSYYCYYYIVMTWISCVYDCCWVASHFIVIVWIWISSIFVGLVCLIIWMKLKLMMIIVTYAICCVVLYYYYCWLI